MIGTSAEKYREYASACRCPKVLLKISTGPCLIPAANFRCVESWAITMPVSRVDAARRVNCPTGIPRTLPGDAMTDGSMAYPGGISKV